MKQAKVIGVAAIAGGSGKTSVSIGLCAALTLKKKKVILVDADGQATATYILKIPTPSISDIMKDSSKTSFVANEIEEGFKGVSADSKMFVLQYPKGRFKELLEPLKAEADYIIIDFPPALSTNYVEIIKALDYMLIPSQANTKGLLGASQMIEYLNALKVSKEKIHVPEVLGVVLNQYNSRYALHQWTCGFLAGQGLLFETKIPECQAQQKADSLQRSVISNDKKSKVSQAYIELSKEVINKTK